MSKEAIQECCSNLGISTNEFESSWHSYALNNGLNIGDLTDDRLETFRSVLASSLRRKKPKAQQQQPPSSGGLSLLLSGGMSSEGVSNSAAVKGQVVVHLNEIDYTVTPPPVQLSAPTPNTQMYKAFFKSKSAVKEEDAKELSDAFIQFKLSNTDLIPADSLSLQQTTTFGRILLIKEEDNEQLAMLQCPNELGGGIAYLSFDLLSSSSISSIFHGQICGLRGSNPTGRCFKVNDMLPSLQRVQPPPLPSTKNIVAICCGPFLNHNHLNALDAALALIHDRKPSVALILGPFIHESQSKLLSMCMDDLYGIIVGKLKKSALKAPNIKHVILPSPFEAGNCLPLYPCPPLSETNRCFKELVF